MEKFERVTRIIFLRSMENLLIIRIYRVGSFLLRPIYTYTHIYIYVDVYICARACNFLPVCLFSECPCCVCACMGLCARVCTYVNA